jgi:hypothetical protein
MADYTHLTARLTGPELNYNAPLTGPSIFGFNLTSNNPWLDEINKRAMAKGFFGLLGGGVGSGLLSLGFKAQDALNPNRPFYGPEKKEDPSQNRDDSYAQTKEERRLWNEWKRLGRMADLAKWQNFKKTV